MFINEISTLIMPEPSSSSAASGVAFLIKTYGIKTLGVIASAALILAIWPARTFKEGLIRMSAAVTCSVIFGDVAVSAAQHYFPWLLESPQDPLRIAIYSLAGGPAYLVLGFGARMLEAGTKNPLAVLKILRGSSKG